MKIRKKIKKIRLHHEGTHILIAGVILLAISVYYRHRANIKRIHEGCENRLSFKKKESTEEVKTEPVEEVEEKQ